MRQALIVLAKWPQPGAVKTRLSVDIGPGLADAVYRGLAEAEIAATRPRGKEYERLYPGERGAAQPAAQTVVPVSYERLPK